MILAALLSAATQILYIRHGEVPGNTPNASYVYTGSGTDDSLTEKGVSQAEECAQKLKAQNLKIAALYASNLKRAIQTAEPIARELGLSVEICPELKEISWGVADGQLVQKMSEEWGALEQEIRQLYPDRKIRWDHLPVFPQAETYNDLLARTLKAFQSIHRAHPGETVIIVGHGRVLKTLIAEAVNLEENIPYPPNCGIAVFTYSDSEGLNFLQ